MIFFNCHINSFFQRNFKIIHCCLYIFIKLLLTYLHIKYTKIRKNDLSKNDITTFLLFSNYFFTIRMEKEDTNVDYENENESMCNYKDDYIVNEKSESTQKLTTLYLDRFVKPFSVEDVKAFLLETVPPINTQEHFFMSKFDSVDDTVRN